MKLWTPIAACSVALFAVVAGCVVHEGPMPPPPPSGAGEGCHGQPNMAAALHDLKEARGWLDRAEHNKDGWRVKAIEAAETAVNETARGCEFNDTH